MKVVTWLPKTIGCGIGFHYKGVNGLSCTQDRSHCTHCGRSGIFFLLRVDNSPEQYSLVREQVDENCSSSTAIVAGMIIRPLVWFITTFAFAGLLIVSIR